MFNFWLCDQTINVNMQYTFLSFACPSLKLALYEEKLNWQGWRKCYTSLLAQISKFVCVMQHFSYLFFPLHKR